MIAALQQVMNQLASLPEAEQALIAEELTRLLPAVREQAGRTWLTEAEFDEELRKRTEPEVWEAYQAEKRARLAHV